MKNLILIAYVAALTLVLPAANLTTLNAQSADMAAKAQQFGASAKANAQALRMYTWQMRVQITLKGDPKPAKLYQMNFDADGKVQKTLLTPSAPPEQERGLKGRIKEKKIAEMKEWAGDLADLCKGYLAPSPALLQTFFSKVMTVQAPGGFVQMYAEGVIIPGDKLVYEVDPKTQALNRVLFNTILEGDPVDGTVQITTVPGGGPSHAAQVTVNVPKKKITATIENFNYVRQ
jgi:hypothetical protein